MRLHHATLENNVRCFWPCIAVFWGIMDIEHTIYISICSWNNWAVYLQQALRLEQIRLRKRHCLTLRLQRKNTNVGQACRSQSKSRYNSHLDNISWSTQLLVYRKRCPRDALRRQRPCSIRLHQTFIKSHDSWDEVAYFVQLPWVSCMQLEKSYCKNQSIPDYSLYVASQELHDKAKQDADSQLHKRQNTSIYSSKISLRMRSSTDKFWHADQIWKLPTGPPPRSGCEQYLG